MDAKKSNESLAPLKQMKSLLKVHKDKKPVIRNFEKELQKFKKMVDDLVKLNPHQLKLINEKIR